MSQQTVTLIAAIVAAIVSVASLILNSRFTLDREHRLVVWRKEVDRTFELEELAGKLTEQIGSYAPIAEAESLQFAQQIKQLGAMGGRMARHPDVLQSTRGLCQRLMILLHDRVERQRVGSQREELDEAHHRLIEGCDRVLERRSV